MIDSDIKLVAITQRIDCIPTRNENRDSLDQRMISWLTEVGVQTVTIPNALQVPKQYTTGDTGNIGKWLDRIKPDAFLLSGGNDIGEYESRDNLEYFLLNYAETRKMPVLGICRGMQTIAVWSGVKLKKVEGHVRTRHELKANKCEKNISKIVNSYHEWSIEDCPENFEIVATSKDGCIEAIKHTVLSWEGWMWHPEREMAFSVDDINRAKRIFYES